LIRSPLIDGFVPIATYLKRLVITPVITLTSASGCKEGSFDKLSSNDKRFERKSAKNGEPYFVLKAMNGEIMCTIESVQRIKDKGSWCPFY
jgi:hypothetical protein